MEGLTRIHFWSPLSITVCEKEYRSEVTEPILDLKIQYDTIEKVTALYKAGLTELGKDSNGTYEVIYLTSGTDELMNQDRNNIIVHF